MMLKVFEKLPNAEKITVDEIIEEQQSLPKLIQKGEIGEIKAHFEENPKGARVFTSKNYLRSSF